MGMSTLDGDAPASAASDPEARFDALFDEHARAVLAYCLRRSNATDAQDGVQIMRNEVKAGILDAAVEPIVVSAANIQAGLEIAKQRIECQGTACREARY